MPNGNRIYYLKRSQPPYLIPAVYEYLSQSKLHSTYRFAKAREFLKEVLPYLRTEFSFWEKNRSVELTMKDGSKHHLFRFYTEANTRGLEDTMDTENANVFTTEG